ncbi:MAG: aldehyde dehydrogenase family protein, partial [Microbacteriaceae bacterium]|nr:aldehyde dehydrogenase family protein [Microbacteriaceae bacterium]
SGEPAAATPADDAAGTGPADEATASGAPRMGTASHEAAASDAPAADGTGASPAAEPGASGTAAAQWPVGPTGEVEPARTGPAPNLTEVVLGLRQGRRLRSVFRNDPPSDPMQRPVREWADRIRRRAARSELGIAEAAEHNVGSVDEIREILDRGDAAGAAWSATSGWERAARLEVLAKAIEANRARLIEVAMNETGLTFGEVDVDVSRAIDLANYDAHLARELDRMQGARFEPVRLSVVVPGWIMPVSSTAAVVLGTLAAGSAVVLKPSPRTQRTAAVLARVLWAAGVPRDLLQVAACDDRLITEEQLGRELITDERVERVLMQGAYETAERFLMWRPDLPLVGSSGGKSSVVVTGAADYDLAAAEIARSLVTSSGQRPNRPSVAILVGAAGRSERFASQLVDAVSAVRIGYPADPSVHAGPLGARATAKQVEALTDLAEGERWLLRPRPLDDAGRLWTPGVRVVGDVDSTSARNDAPVPVLNLLTARSLDEAIELQNALDYGLSCGLFSLDRAEIAQWVQRVEAGNLAVNRDLLGDAVQRQPYGGWKRSMIGTKLKSGGPNTLLHLGAWRADPEQEQSHTLHLRGLEDRVQRLIEALQANLPFDAFEQVRRTALSCQIAWNEEFGEVIDRAGLGVERNLFRYRPVRCLIRAAGDASAAELGQVLVAAVVARAPIVLSTARPLPPVLLRELEHLQADVVVESDGEFLERMGEAGLAEAPRLRLVGGSRSGVCSALRNGVDVAVFSDDVTLAGRLEMLPFLREQSISITAHRAGHPDERVAALFPHERTVDADD